MIWSLLKVLFFVAIAAALTWGAGLILETPGEIRLAFAGYEINPTPLAFLVGLIILMLAVWLLLRIAGFLVAVLRFLVGDRTAISRYLDRSRERRGFDALSQSLMALASGDPRKAQTKAVLAEKLLDRPELTRLLNAQAAEASGNAERATTYYKAMLTDDKSRFVGVQGLLRQQLEAGNTDTALKLAEKAFALKPRHGGTLDTLFDLQSRKADWAGARRTLNAKVRASTLPRDVGKRREAVLSLADARAAMAEGSTARAREAAYEANRLAPDFVPAAALAATLHAQAGEGRTAAKIVRKAWASAPHPDLAAAFAQIEPDETPAARQRRFAQLLKIRPEDPETRMVAAELALAAEDFPAARRALGDLAETKPTTRSLAIMAAIERGEGAPDAVVRGWLAKALSVPRGEAWICTNCNHIHGAWVAMCERCEAFDTLAWKQPPESQDAGTGATGMLPLIVGALERGGDATETEPVAEHTRDAAEEAEVVTEAEPQAETVADQPRASTG